MKNRKAIVAVVVVVAIVVLGYLLYLFQPWALFTTKEVNEAPPTPTVAVSGKPTQSAPVVVGSGTFISLNHPTSGTATLLKSSGGKQTLRLTDFETDNGPDVKVWLSVRPAADADAARDAQYVNLGDLKGNVGNQNYELPPSATGTKWRSVVIWCDRFSVPFGAANLS